MKTLDKKITFIRAFDTMDPTDRVVVNYSRTDEALTTPTNVWNYIDRVFVHCNGVEFYVDLRKFDILDSSERLTDEIVSKDFVVTNGGKVGQREILFNMKSRKHTLRILFLNRDKTFRLVKNTFSKTKLKGELFTRRVVELDALNYIENV